MLFLEQTERYSRHIMLPEVGAEGQIKLLESKVLIIGVGGLGSPAALYLAAAGVGTIGIADDDTVDLSNLQRQIIHQTPDIGKPKVISAWEKMRAVNPDVTVITYQQRLKATTIRDHIKDYDFIIDGTDNFAAKFLINDACILEGKPFVHAGVIQFTGQAITVLPHESACYRCIFTSLPQADIAIPSSQAGIFGVVPGVIGSIEATEAIKYFLQRGELLTNRLLTYNALTLSFRIIPLRKNPRCAICGENPTITELRDEPIGSHLA